MLYNDSLSESDRSRVFNMCIVPSLNEVDENGRKKIFRNVTRDLSYILFSYHFDDNVFKYKNTYDLIGLKTQFLNEDSGENHYDSFIDQLEITSDNSDEKFYVCIFHYGPRGDFHPSMYSFDLTVIDNWNDSIIMGNPPKISTYNSWFSNRIIKSMINWETFLEKKFHKNGELWAAPPGNVLVFLFTEYGEGTQQLISVDFNQYLLECKKALVPLDMQKLIKEEYLKGNLLIINVVNYLRDYFLLVRINQDQLTFISSPGDQSLNSKSE